MRKIFNDESDLIEAKNTFCSHLDIELSIKKVLKFFSE